MIILTVLLIYVLLSAAGYVLMNLLYKKGIKSLPNVKHKWVYYLLQFTWGLPMNILGVIVAICLLISGKRPIKYGWNYCFGLNVNFGMEMGIFFIAPVHASAYLKNHEHGHAIQNIYFGPFSVGMVSIPSALRFWIRELKTKIGIKLKTNYDDIWFEG